MNLYQKSLKVLESDVLSRPFYTDKLLQMVSSKNIVVVTGQRRTGKSMIILDFLKKEKVDISRVFYVNKELDSLGELPDTIALEKLFQEAGKDTNSFEYIIIDEIQDIISWEQFIRAKAAEKKYKIIITGSNSRLLSGELATFLTGRYITLDIFPLTFEEYCVFSETDFSKENFLTYLEF